MISDPFGLKNVLSLRPPYRGGGGGASKSMTTDEHFKLCPALVQEQVYTWVIASSFVMLLVHLEALQLRRTPRPWDRIGLYRVAQKECNNFDS